MRKTRRERDRGEGESWRENERERMYFGRLLNKKNGIMGISMYTKHYTMQGGHTCSYSIVA